MLISNLLSSFKLVHCKYIYRERETAGGVCEKEKDSMRQRVGERKTERGRRERQTDKYGKERERQRERKERE